MHLKRLTVQGFKSFADRTQFEFENFARSDDRWNFRASTTWKVNRNLWVDGSYELTDQTSDVQDFSENRFLVGLRIFP